MNQLKHKREFEKILRDYTLPKGVSDLLKGMKLVLLIGPTAAGRNTIIEELVASGGFVFIVSDTTRKPRLNNGIMEKNGDDYWFRKEDEFLSDLKKGEFLEAEVIHDQQVSGISIRELKKVHDFGKIAVSDVDIKGFINIINRKPDTIGIYVLPPSFDTWLERIESRSELPKEEIINRLKTGLRIFEMAKQSKDHVIINDELNKAVDLVDRIAHGQKVEESIDTGILIDDLITKTKEYIKRHTS